MLLWISRRQIVTSWVGIAVWGIHSMIMSLMVFKVWRLMILTFSNLERWNQDPEITIRSCRVILFQQFQGSQLFSRLLTTLKFRPIAQTFLIIWIRRWQNQSRIWTKTHMEAEAIMNNRNPRNCSKRKSPSYLIRLSWMKKKMCHQKGGKYTPCKNVGSQRKQLYQASLKSYAQDQAE